MVWKSCHGVSLCRSIVSSGQRDAEYARGIHCVIAVGLVEVAATEEQQRIRVLCFEVEELFHHRRQFAAFLCHFYVVFLSCCFIIFI